MEDLTYEQTIELEKNIAIKNRANETYNNFKRYFILKVSDYNPERQMFKIWSDSHNAAYLDLCDGVFVYRARFLHESYDVTITPSNLFHYIKNDYRGYEHFEASVRIMMKKALTEAE